ncbi:unnamed protein product, partial [Mesorhabditis belari]|uniref:NADP-dependent oxidoreductase domain-containing protein n=1 Tax=Mesorhabditis belari TaxID=2138241 RepID=A0AAF3F9L4_9BILA
MATPSLRLSSGHSIPALGLGTWLSKPGEVGQAVEMALKAGYRHIDCAHVYGNQKEIGEVFAKVFDGQLQRSDVFVTSKIWNTFHSYEKAKEAVDIILGELQLDYVDLMLIHWPMGYEEGNEILPKTPDGTKIRYSKEDYLGTWKALEEAVNDGKIRSLGLSNFNHKQIERLIGHSRIKPAVLQVELHPYFQQKKLRDFCKKHQIVVTAYSPLGNPTNPFRKTGDPSILTDEVVLKIAEKSGKSPAQVALRWAIQTGLVVIPKSTSEHRIKENGALFDFELSQGELAEIDGLDKNWRILDLTQRDGDHPHFPFSEEF